ncbi:DnaJ-domain-containing protein [Wolfiporia cocos MD-104 SS10]|uniref:DnaJ-domain-containing protein n=1 Tax=Wolfiporia cocos (strain MD-104) TaxID=742152 RepID=A0A2H3JHK9_WOLCO|nr:DnaJ-domain-containing protein [Wolfiporia cocos MD-104 SS10]
MRIVLLLCVLATLVAIVTAWTKEDHEIFDLVSAVEASEGKGTTFYSWLGVRSTASTGEISKAYRKKSITLHPDKNPGVKGAHERFARLGVVATILRDPEGRKRYDFFYKNGVPKWRGTGYYYSRFRPGLGTVLIFLVLLTSVLQYVVQSINYKRDLARIETIVGLARSAAWGSKLTPLEGQKKVKVNLGGGLRVDEDGNVVSGKMVDMAVEGPNVYIVDSDNILLPVNADSATPPSIKRTWFVALVLALYVKVARRTDHQSNGEDALGDSEEADDASASETPRSGTTTPKEAGMSQVKASRVPTTMAGGRRRKVVRKR